MLNNPHDAIFTSQPMNALTLLTFKHNATIFKLQIPRKQMLCVIPFVTAQQMNTHQNKNFFFMSTNLGNSLSSSHFTFHLGKIVVVGGHICDNDLLIRSINIHIYKFQGKKMLLSTSNCCFWNKLIWNILLLLLSDSNFFS